MVIEYTRKEGVWTFHIDNETAKIERAINIHDTDYGKTIKEKLMAAEYDQKMVISGFDYSETTHESRKDVLHYMSIVCPKSLRTSLPTKNRLANFKNVGDIFMVRQISERNISCISLERCKRFWSLVIVECECLIKL